MRQSGVAGGEQSGQARPDAVPRWHTPRNGTRFNGLAFGIHDVTQGLGATGGRLQVLEGEPRRRARGGCAGPPTQFRKDLLSPEDS